jgi:hypothetical protein
MSNQPLSAHPIPAIRAAHGLGSNSKIVKAATSGDFLLVAPPSADPNGIVSRLTLPASVRLLTDPGEGGLAAGAVQLIYKAEGGREALLQQNSGGELQGDVFRLDGSLILKTTDLGIFLRVSAAATVDAICDSVDLRGADRIAADITAIFPNKQTVVANTEEGQVLVGTALEGVEDVIGALFNFDGNAHVVRVFVSDGTNEFELPSLTVPAGETSSLNISTLTLPEGWSLKACLDVGDAVPTLAPRLQFGMQYTNAAPVRTNQGGAY